MGFIKKLFGDEDPQKVAEYREANKNLQDFYDQQVQQHGRGNVRETADFLRLNSKVNEAAEHVSTARQIAERIKGN